MNTTRWNSLAKMGRSQLQHKGFFHTNSSSVHSTYVFFLQLLDIIRRCLERNKEYDLIMRETEIKFLEDFVEVLEVFQVFTSYVQGDRFPTLNTLILFRSEIINK